MKTVSGLCFFEIQLQLKLLQLDFLHNYLRSLGSCFLVSFSYLLPLGDQLSMLLGVVIFLASRRLHSLPLLPGCALVFLQKIRVEDPAQGVSYNMFKLYLDDRGGHKYLILYSYAQSLIL